MEIIKGMCTGFNFVADGVFRAVFGGNGGDEIPKEESNDHVDASHEGRSEYLQYHLRAMNLIG